MVTFDSTGYAPDMEKKHVALGAGAVVAIIAVLLYPSARFALFTLGARETIEKLGRFPSAQDITGLPDRLKETAARYKMDPAQLQVRMALEERSMMGAVSFTFLLVTVTEGKRTWSYSVGGQAGHRCETSIENLLSVEEAGVEIRRAPAPAPAPAAADGD
jgi:hypothetical protein